MLNFYANVILKGGIPELKFLLIHASVNNENYFCLFSFKILHLNGVESVNLVALIIESERSGFSLSHKNVPSDIKSYINIQVSSFELDSIKFYNYCTTVPIKPNEKTIHNYN